MQGISVIQGSALPFPLSFPDVLLPSAGPPSFSFSAPLSTLVLDPSVEDGPEPEPGCEEVGSSSGAVPPNRLLLSMTISFNQPFSRLSSAASRSSSSTRPDKSEIERSKLSVHCFFFTRNRASESSQHFGCRLCIKKRLSPDAAVFRRRLSSAITICSASVSSTPSGDAGLEVAETDTARVREGPLGPACGVGRGAV